MRNDAAHRFDGRPVTQRKPGERRGSTRTSGVRVAGPARVGGDGGVDWLLLNASNFPDQPIYPYAFIQLGALARRYGKSIRFADFLGVERADYVARVERLIAEHRPRLIGVHLRQADSVVYAKYVSERGAPYFPVEDTQALIAAVRSVTDTPIVLGGFGFTTHAPELFAHLQPDFGVEGEPDGVFAAFDDVCRRRRLEHVDNLLFQADGALRRPSRTFYAPLDEREYDEAALRELEAFYGRALLYGPDAPSVAVELARGCPYRCYFCTEPNVKGRSERRRNLDAVMGDIEFLARRGVRRFWMVCSEINLKDATLALELAERFLRLAEAGQRNLQWHAYHLPRWLSRADLELLQRSGYAGGWNDFPSLDDDNLRKARVPYRARHVVEHVKNTLDLNLGAPAPARVSLFLGNAFSDTRTFARSLKVFDDAGFADRFAGADVGAATRLFARGNGTANAPGADRAVSFTSAGRSLEVELVHPTFYVAPALAEHFPSDRALLELLDYVGSTLLSVRHQEAKDWPRFLASSASVAWLAQSLRGAWKPGLRLGGVTPEVAEEVERILCGVAGPEGEAALRAFLVDPAASLEVRRCASLLMVHRLSLDPPARFLRALRELGIEHDERGRVTSSSYRVLTALLRRAGSARELFVELERSWGIPDESREAWLMRLLLFSKNIVLRASYRPFVLGETDERVRAVPDHEPMEAVP